MAAPSQGTIDFFGKFGDGMAIGGALGGAVNSMFAAKFEKNKLKMQGVQFQHQEAMAKINAKSIEMQAQHIARQYDKQLLMRTIQQGQQSGKRRAQMGKRGGTSGYGSAKEVAISQELLNELDKKTINVNKVKAVGNMRTRAVDARIQADMLGVSAGNMFASSNSVSPFLNMSSSLLTGAGNVASQFANRYGYGTV